MSINRGFVWRKDALDRELSHLVLLVSKDSDNPNPKIWRVEGNVAWTSQDQDYEITGIISIKEMVPNNRTLLLHLRKVRRLPSLVETLKLGYYK